MPQTLLSPSEALLLHPLTQVATPSNIRENHGIVTGNVNARSSVPSIHALAHSNSRGSDTPILISVDTNHCTWHTGIHVDKTSREFFKIFLSFERH